MTVAKPALRPTVPHFSSGPCAKRPGWNPQNLKDAALGRSHRAKLGKAKLKLVIDLTREVLEVPADYRIGIVPASDTGAVEMALWSLLGARPVTTLAWESFGEGWVSDIVKELKLKDVTKLHAGYGDLPDLSKVDQASDVVFTWNGTTSGVRVPNADWIKADRQGLTICDATSAAFAAGISSHISTISRARRSPTMIVSHCVAPPAGTDPCSGPTWRMNASSTITARSQAIWSSFPPPTQMPLIRATVALPIRRSAVTPVSIAVNHFQYSRSLPT